MTNQVSMHSAESKGSSCPSVTLRSEKISNHHLERFAYVYVRQSTPQQLVRHQESTQVQYSLQRRAVDLGWSQERVVVVDEDLGKSGASAEGRAGFQRMVAEVTLNHVGIIFGVEMSRLARSCKDWYHLLEVCGVFGTLIADLDGVYDPSLYNDRLLLGLKGTMSEAELHILKQRMYQGTLNKARRAELVTHVPMGYFRRLSGEVVIDPDEGAQEVIRMIFRKFQELGSVHATLQFFVAHAIKLPVRPHFGPNVGELEWRRPCRGTLLGLLKNPMYAGAYAYGRRAIDPRARIPGCPRSGARVVPPARWHAFTKDRYPAYIGWDQYQANLERLKANRPGSDGVGVPREGSALLAGLIVCGRCGVRMSIAYQGRANRHTYLCAYRTSQYGGPRCQSLSGGAVDQFVSAQVLKAIEPASLELSLRAAQNIESQRQEMDGVWQKRLERARYEAQRAERHYRHIEPENRLVARELARQWEETLKSQRDLNEDYDRLRRNQPRLLSEGERDAIALLAKDIPALWTSPTTTCADRKEIVRQIVDRVVVDVVGNTERVRLRIEWAGGTHTEHEMLKPVRGTERLSYWPELAEYLRKLVSAGHTAAEIARQMNQAGWCLPLRRSAFTGHRIWSLARRLGLRLRLSQSKNEATLQMHEWWLSSLAEKLGITKVTLRAWARKGWVQARRSDDGLWIVHADPKTMERLQILRDAPRGFEVRRRYLREKCPLPEQATPSTSR